jgi:hypothetical protein
LWALEEAFTSWFLVHVLKLCMERRTHALLEDSAVEPFSVKHLM